MQRHLLFTRSMHLMEWSCHTQNAQKTKFGEELQTLRNAKITHRIIWPESLGLHQWNMGCNLFLAASVLIFSKNTNQYKFSDKYTTWSYDNQSKPLPQRRSFDELNVIRCRTNTNNYGKNNGFIDWLVEFEYISNMKLRVLEDVQILII